MRDLVRGEVGYLVFVKEAVTSFGSEKSGHDVEESRLACSIGTNYGDYSR